MRVLYLDCFSGISGDMTVGALRHLGVPEERFAGAIESLQIPDLRVRFEQGRNGGIGGIRLLVDGSHEHHPERHYREIAGMLARSALPEKVKQRADSIFHRIAVAEAAVHSIPLDDVHFHEVGALDSIADIVCAATGFDALGIDRVLASKLQEGSGWVECAHGRFPVPAPATLEILRGIPFVQTGEPFEFITPTGAAIVAEYAEAFGPMPAMVVDRVGYGLGTRTIPGRPNVLRAVLGTDATAEVPGGFEQDVATLIETNLDDLSPEIAGAVLVQLMEAGALDAWITPVQMKKNRPGFLLSVLAPPSRVQLFAEILMRETSAFGVRLREVSRLKLARRMESVDTCYGEVRVKIGESRGEIWQVAPEFESCKAAAERAGVPVKSVFAEAIRALKK